MFEVSILLYLGTAAPPTFRERVLSVETLETGGVQRDVAVHVPPSAGCRIYVRGLEIPGKVGIGRYTGKL